MRKDRTGLHVQTLSEVLESWSALKKLVQVTSVELDQKPQMELSVVT
jgi:hypothetical protein